MKLNFIFLKTTFLAFIFLFSSKTFPQNGDHNKMESLFNEARNYYVENQLEKAEEKYKELLTIDSKNKKGLYGLFLTYNTQKKYNKLINEFEEHEFFFDSKAHKVRYYLYMAEAYFFKNKPEKGATYLEKYYDLVDVDTLLPSDFLLVSLIYFEYEHYDLALEQLEFFYNHNDTARSNDEVAFLHFKILYEKNQNDKALERVNDLLTELKPEDQVDFLLTLVDYTTSDESAEGAKPYLEKILSESYSEHLDRNLKAYSQFALGVLQLGEGKEKEGINYLKSVATKHLSEEYKPDFYKAILSQTINNDFEGFQKYIELAKQDYPNEFYFEALHGMFHAQLGNQNKADKYFIKSFQKVEIGDFYNHTEILTKINDYYSSINEDKYSLYHKVKDISDADTSHYIVLGQISYNHERMTVGDNFFELVIESSDKEKFKARIRYLQSIFYIRIMRVEEAKGFLNQAYELDNQNYYLLCKQYYDLTNLYHQDNLSSKDFEKLLEIAQKTEEGPQEVVSFLKAMAHFNLDQKEEACASIKPFKDQFLSNNINAKIFCMKYGITSRQFDESFKLLGTYMTNY